MTFATYLCAYSLYANIVILSHCVSVVIHIIISSLLLHATFVSWADDNVARFAFLSLQ